MIIEHIQFLRPSEAIVFVASFDDLSNIAQFEEIRALLCARTCFELRSIKCRNGVVSMFQDTPEEIMKTIKLHNTKVINIPLLMFDWLWPALRQHIMNHWLPSQSSLVHERLITATQAQRHWNVLILAAFDIAYIFRNTATQMD
jgi:hypothetical protein